MSTIPTPEHLPSETHQANGLYSLVSTHPPFIFTAGITPRRDGELIAQGIAEVDISPEEMEYLAHFTAKRLIQVLTQHGFNTIRPLMLHVYVASQPHQQNHSRYADACSKVLVDHYKHQPARVAVGVASLPGNAPIEISLIAVNEVDA